MPWLMVYTTVAVAVLSLASACCARGVKRDPSRLLAIVAAAALWPVVVVGLVQLGVVHLYARVARQHAHAPAGPVERASFEPEPATAPMVLLDSLARIAQQVSVKHPV